MFVFVHVNFVHKLALLVRSFSIEKTASFSQSQESVRLNIITFKVSEKCFVHMTKYSTRSLFSVVEKDSTFNKSIMNLFSELFLNIKLMVCDQKIVILLVVLSLQTFSKFFIFRTPTL